MATLRRLLMTLTGSEQARLHSQLALDPRLTTLSIPHKVGSRSSLNVTFFFFKIKVRKADFNPVPQGIRCKPFLCFFFFLNQLFAVLYIYSLVLSASFRLTL